MASTDYLTRRTFRSPSRRRRCSHAARGPLLSHHSAATLWGLRPGTARPVHVTLCEDRGGPRPAGVRIHRSRTITAADIRLHQGLPVTSPARTLLDIAVTLTDRDVERLLDEALFARRILTRADLRDVVACWLRVRRGARPLVVHPGWRTDLDTAVAVVLATVRRARTPEPLRQARRVARAARGTLRS